MRGFAISLVSVSLIVLLVILSVSLRAGYLSMERAISEPQPLIYASFMLDSIGHDVSSMVGPDINLYQKNDSFEILITDTIPAEDFSSDLADYEGFLESTIANESHASIDADFSALAPDNMDVTINEDYIYSRDDNDTITFTASGGTEAPLYEINITVFEPRGNVTPFSFNPGGDLNVTFRYTDANGTIEESGKVRSNQQNSFEVDYVGGGELDVIVGRVGGDNGGLSIEADGLDADVSFSVTLPPLDSTKKMGYEYDAMVDYVQDDIRINRNIGG